MPTGTRREALGVIRDTVVNGDVVERTRAPQVRRLRKIVFLPYASLVMVCR